MNNSYSQLANLIKTQRNKKGYSIRELSDLVDKSTGFISTLEQGLKDHFDLELMHKLSEVLDIPLIFFICPNSFELIGYSPSKVLPESTMKAVNELLSKYISVASDLNFDEAKLSLLNEMLSNEIACFSKLINLNK